MLTKNKNWKINWENPKLVLRLVDSYKGRNQGLDRGFGVFAQASIKKGTIITIFGGYVIPIQKVKFLNSQLREYCYQIHDDFLFGPVLKKEISIGEHFNHSCNPNAGFQDSITLVSMKNIAKGEEVTIDYAMCMATRLFDFRCSCGSSNCRVFITGHDWKIPSLQKKYSKYFQPFIKHKIK